MSYRHINTRKWILCFTLYGACISYGATLHVSQSSLNPVSPYTNWAAAATDIQMALDAAVDGDTVLVTNGVYATGGTPTLAGDTVLSRITVSNDVTVCSVNGPSFTYILGEERVRCAYFRQSEGGRLVGFTLSNGSAIHSPPLGLGGAVFGDTSSVVSNCVITSCSGEYGLLYQGRYENCVIENNLGPYRPGPTLLKKCVVRNNSTTESTSPGFSHTTFENCLITGNNFTPIYNSTLTHCTVLFNRGGVDDCTVNNSIVYYNDLFPGDLNYSNNSTFVNSCTHPLPTLQSGCITNDPGFEGGSAYLHTNSPCVDAGSPLLTEDFMGSPRPLDGNADGIAAPDMGAYEILNQHADTDGDGILDHWELSHLLDPLNNLDGKTDTDGDLVLNIDEFFTETNPHDSNSFLRITGADYYFSIGNYFRFESTSSNRLYDLLWTDDLATGKWETVDGATDIISYGSQSSATFYEKSGFYTIRAKQIE